MRALLRVDQFITSSRPLWTWLGQLAVVVLGVHLVADRLDDIVHDWLLTLPWDWGEGGTPVLLAAWIAIILELLVVARAAGMLLLTSVSPDLSIKRWWRSISIDAVVLPLFWAPVAMAGCWAAAMALEDLLIPMLGDQVTYGIWAIALVIAWRLGWSGLRRVIGAIENPKRRTQGLFWSPILLTFAGLAAAYGVPVWGWFQ